VCVPGMPKHSSLLYLKNTFLECWTALFCQVVWQNN